MNRRYSTACFIDTSFFYAILDKSDKWHVVCRQVFDQVRAQMRPLVTTGYVVAETHTLLLYKLGQNIATPWLKDIRKWVEVILPSPNIEERAIEILEQYADQKFTFTDAISFATVESFDIPIVLSADKHFVIYRGEFLTVPLVTQSLPAI